MCPELVAQGDAAADIGNEFPAAKFPGIECDIRFDGLLKSGKAIHLEKSGFPEGEHCAVEMLGGGDEEDG